MTIKMLIKISLFLLMLSIECMSSPVVIDSQKVVASDRQSGDRFGWSIDTNKNLFIAGAIFDDENGQYSGSAYIFEFTGDGWVETQKIQPEDGSFGDWFGSEVLIIDQNTIAVSADSKSQDKVEFVGAVYIFERTYGVWTQTHKLTPPGKPTLNSFGWAISHSLDSLFIGAKENGDKAFRSGAVYVFNRVDSNWQYQTTLHASDFSTFDFFGSNVQSNADTLIVSANYKDNSGSNQGAIYVFENSNNSWLETQKIVPTDIKDNDYFGSSLDIQNNILFIGARNPTNGEDPGSLYVFSKEGNNWIYKDEIHPSENIESDRFGQSLSYVNGILAVETDQTELGGMVSFYECDNGNWNKFDSHLFSNDHLSRNYGSNVKMNSGNLILSDPLENGPNNGFYVGAAFIFKLDRIYKSQFDKCY